MQPVCRVIFFGENVKKSFRVLDFFESMLYNNICIVINTFFQKSTHYCKTVCYKIADFLYISALYLNVESGILQAFAAAEPVILPALHL